MLSQSENNQARLWGLIFSDSSLNIERVNSIILGYSDGSNKKIVVENLIKKCKLIDKLLGVKAKEDGIYLINLCTNVREYELENEVVSVDLLREYSSNELFNEVSVITGNVSTNPIQAKDFDASFDNLINVKLVLGN